MKKVEVKEQNEIRIKGIVGFIEKGLTPFGTGAKVDCLEGYLGKTLSRNTPGPTIFVPKPVCMIIF